MRIHQPARTFSHSAMAAAAVGRVGFFSENEEPGGDYNYKNQRVSSWSEDAAYLHSLVLGNNGRVLNKLLDVENSAAVLKTVCLTRPANHFDGLAANTPKRLAIYVHGGLNDEKESIKRIRVMAPYFFENEIYPLFITWKSGFLEGLTGMLVDSAREIFRALPEIRDEGLWDAVKKRLAEARDRSVEVACEKLLVKAIWAKMKQSAQAAGTEGGGVHSLMACVANLKADFSDIQVHQCEVAVHRKNREYVSTGPRRIKLAHDSFDNDVKVISNLLVRIRDKDLVAKVENLDYQDRFMVKCRWLPADIKHCRCPDIPDTRSNGAAAMGAAPFYFEQSECSR